MYTELHWIEGHWKGKLAISARPRGGDWLDEELTSWRNSGVDEVVSLLTEDEVESLELRYEATYSQDAGMRFRSFPIIDRWIPASRQDAVRLIQDLDGDLMSGKNVSIHCRQGIGRAALIAAALLVARGLAPSDAFGRVGLARGVSVPETAEQRVWLESVAPELGAFHHPLVK